MVKTLSAVYENGVLRPLESLPLKEHQHVRVTVSDGSDDRADAWLDQEYMASIDAIQEPEPTLEEVRASSRRYPATSPTTFGRSGTPEANRRWPPSSTPARACFIARLGVLEMHSALALKERTGAISAAESEIVRRKFRGDIGTRRFRVIASK